MRMRVFVIGATGFIGPAIVRELIDAAGARSLIDAGAQGHRGDLEDMESLRGGAATSDGVIHTAFNHDFSKFAANCEMDRHAIEALGSALAGSDRPLVVTSGTALVAPGRLATEEDVPVPGTISYPRVSEETAASAAAGGVRASVVRLPQVHDRVKQGLEKGSAGARHHAVAEEGVALREIAEAIGRGLKVPVVSKSPEEAAQHFGFLGFFVGVDCPASSALTQERLGWRPTSQPGRLKISITRAPSKPEEYI